ncbi:MAG: alpha-L-fucosidase, partial [Ignavibacteria bacterium]|nr:alpha-L-fucosidase [Ignavibacteria bacterium]
MIKKIISVSSLIFLVSLFTLKELSAQYNIPQKMEWWYEARFGMFIHFGSYSHLGHGEWAFSIEGWTKENYQTEVSSKFNPSNYDAGVIARLAKQAGMKYLVITAKHHEGFSMWKTNVQSFKDVTGTKMYDLPSYTDFGSRDILKELKDSCDANGIKFCLYYSILDWCHSSQEINRSEYYSMMSSDSARQSYIIDMKSQLKELVDRYNPAIMWFDGDWTNYSGPPTPNKWWTKEDGIDLYNYV